MTQTHLETFLSDLLVYIHKNFDTKDTKTLLELSTTKLQSLNIPFETKDIETIYEKLGVANAMSISSPAIVFNKVDLKAIQGMRDSFTWVGAEYNAKTTKKLKDIIEGAFRGKTTRAGLSKKLKEEFSGLIEKDIKYFEGVADHVISQAQNVSRVSESLKYGVEHFKVMATIDNKTSAICRSMNGRIIPAKHLERQVNNVVSAKSIGEKKAAALWSSKPMYGKLPSNFGLPPYHFRCRTEVVPVWLNEEEIDGKIVRFADKNKDDIISHIDKTGVQRKLKKRNIHIFNKHKYTQKKDVISALNSITEIAPHLKNGTRTVAKSANGYFMVFDADEIVTMYKPTNNEGISTLNKHFKENAKIDKKEMIKWKKENLLLKYIINAIGILK